MAGIDVGGHGGKRTVNQELPLVPFIDFLLCLVAFLLLTAAWTHMSRINADARVPGPPNPDKELEEEKKKDRTLHVQMKAEDEFVLVWKEGNTVVGAEISVARKKSEFSGDDFSYPELSAKIADEWKNNPDAHRAPTDLKRDQAVLHTDDSAMFEEVIAVIDAIYKPQRAFRVGNAEEMVPAFNVTFAVN